MLNINEVPARVAVIGGGAIGCEFASFLGDVGSDVTVLEALPQILTGVDKDAADVVVKAFKKRGIKVQTGVKVNGAEPQRRRRCGVVRYDAGKGDERAGRRPGGGQRRPRRPGRRTSGSRAPASRSTSGASSRSTA